MWAPPRSGDGRWIIAQRPSNRCGKRAASLSSGGMTGPIRSTVRKSRVIASDTSGPRRLYAVYSDRPCVAFRQPGDAGILAAPDLLRVSLDIRPEQHRVVEAPVADTVPAAGDLELGDAPQVLDAGQQDGLVAHPCRRRVEDRVGGIGQVDRAQDRVVTRPLEQHRVMDAGHRDVRHRRGPRARGRSRSVDLDGPHVLQRHQPHEGRLGSLVEVDAVGHQAIEAAASIGVGDRDAQIVLAQEPAIRPVHHRAPSDVVGGLVRGLGGEHEGRRLDGLLVEPGSDATLRPPAVADRGEVAVRCGLCGDEPLQGPDARLDHRGVGAMSTGHDERPTWQTVLVGHAGLGPWPFGPDGRLERGSADGPPSDRTSALPHLVSLPGWRPRSRAPPRRRRAGHGSRGSRAVPGRTMPGRLPRMPTPAPSRWHPRGRGWHDPGNPRMRLPRATSHPLVGSCGTAPCVSSNASARKARFLRALGSMAAQPSWRACSRSTWSARATSSTQYP